MWCDKCLSKQDATIINSSEKVKQNDIAIIGGGHNGLVCAWYLASAGVNVTIYERRKIVGGAAVTEEFHPGFRNSVASYTVSLLHPSVIKDLGLYERGLEIIKRPISNFLPTEDGGYLKLGGGLERTQQAVSQFSRKDAERLPEYYRRLENVADVLRQLTITTPPNPKQPLQAGKAILQQVWPVIGGSLELMNDFRALFLGSAQRYLDRWFESDPIKAAFGFDAVVGNYASPKSKASAYVLLHHVFGEIDGDKGAWGHAVGGMGAITSAMREACLEVGVTIRTDAGIQKVLTEQSRVSGLVLANGETVKANLVAANVNPKLLYQQLLDENQLPSRFKQKIDNYRCGSGTFRMNVALDELPDFTCLPGKELAEHHQSGIVIAPTLAYMHQAFIDAKNNGWSENPIVEMLIPSTVDDSLAPEGKHVASLFCQQFAPELDNNRDWQDHRLAAAETIIDTVNKHAPNFRDSILGQQILSPHDLENKFGLIGGDIMHGNMSPDQMWMARPAVGHGDYRGPLNGLYMCGAGTHPGGGVTGLPGKNAAREILRDLEMA